MWYILSIERKMFYHLNLYRDCNKELVVVHTTLGEASNSTLSYSGLVFSLPLHWATPFPYVGAVATAGLLPANHKRHERTGRFSVMQSNLWDTLSKIFDFLDVLTVPTLIWGCWRYVHYRIVARRRRRAILDAAHSSSAILVVTVGQDSIVDAVKKYINTDAGIKEAFGITSAAELTKDQLIEVELKDRIEFRRPARQNADLKRLDRKLKKADKQMKEMGVQRVYLFYCGLIILAAKVGAQLSNRYDVAVYQYDPDTVEKYHYVGCIR